MNQTFLKKQFFGIAGIAILGILLLYLGMKTCNGDSQAAVVELTDVNPNNETAVELQKKIDVFGEQAYAPRAYGVLKADIETAATSGLISDADKGTLIDRLDIRHIDALDTYFRTAFSSSTAPNPEIFDQACQFVRQYANDPKRQGKVNDLNSAIREFNSISNMDSRVSNALNSNDTATLEAMLEEIANLPSDPTLKSSSYLSSVLSAHQDGLKKALLKPNIDSLKKPIEDYTGGQFYDDFVTKDYLKKLDNLENNKWIGNLAEVTQFSSEMKALLRDHTSVDGDFENSLRRTAQSCDDLFGRHHAYRDSCDRVRAGQ